MNTIQTDKAARERGQCPCCGIMHEGSALTILGLEQQRFEPYEKAFDEHAALNAVAEIAQRESRVRLTSVEMDKALADLAAVRGATK